MANWGNEPLLFALDSDGKIVHIDSVANGSGCGCICPSCKQPLVARNGGTKLIHHFAHRAGSCKWAAETAVMLLAHGIIQAEGRMYVEGASYWHYCEEKWFYFSPCGWLDVRSVTAVDLEGHQAPALRIGYIDEKGWEGEFVLMAALAGYISTELVERFQEEGADVLVMNFKAAYAGMRDAEGRHFSRADFFLRVQDPSYIRSVLLDGEGSEVLYWFAHCRRDVAKDEADKRFREELEARWREIDMEFDRKREERRLEAERERAEEERQRAKARECAIEAERHAFEEEGVEALPKVKHGVNFFVDECPLLGQADVVIDCGAYEWSPSKCIFFEGQRYYLIGCTARQNGVGLDV